MKVAVWMVSGWMPEERKGAARGSVTTHLVLKLASEGRGGGEGKGSDESEHVD